jgi:hypothetical protein
MPWRSASVHRPVRLDEGTRGKAGLPTRRLTPSLLCLSAPLITHGKAAESIYRRTPMPCHAMPCHAAAAQGMARQATRLFRPCSTAQPSRRQPTGRQLHFCDPVTGNSVGYGVPTMNATRHSHALASRRADDVLLVLKVCASIRSNVPPMHHPIHETMREPMAWWLLAYLCPLTSHPSGSGPCSASGSGSPLMCIVQGSTVLYSAEEGAIAQALMWPCGSGSRGQVTRQHQELDGGNSSSH